MAARDPYGLGDPPNLSTLWGRVLIDELARCGVRHAVIAPGSRSTPLAFASADHPDVSDLSVLDERSAAFVALGLARATGRPAVVLSTSGTAAANFLPAVAEADRAGVPLLVLTADRPARLRDAGDSQTTDQVKLFGDRVRWFHETPHSGLEPGREEATLRALRSAAAHAWARAAGTGGPPGPVHLNLPFDKPLEPTPAGPGEPGALPTGFDPAGAAAGRPDGAPWLRALPSPFDPPPPPDPATVERVAYALAGARRPLVLVGAVASAGAPGAADRLRHAVARLTDVLPVPVWAEATSGLRFAPETIDRVIGTGELLLASGRFRELLTGSGAGTEGPDLVLRLGEAPVGWGGRRLAADLVASGALQVAVDPWSRRRDPEHGVAWSVAAEPAALLGGVADLLAGRGLAGAVDEGWAALHRQADRAARAALAMETARRPELFDGGVFWRLGSVLPDDAALVVSSSMPLREVEAFLPTVTPEEGGSGRTVDVFANRGLNGIDGVTSTALGVALGRWVDPAAGPGQGGSRTVLVTGDVAFAHDLSGALAAGRLQDQGADLTVVLVNNGGGAIFDHLPAAGREPGFTRHLTTPTGADFAALARGCGLGHHAPTDWKGLEAAVTDALANPGCRVIEVRTDRAQSKAIREEIIGAIAAAVDRTVEGLASFPRPDTGEEKVGRGAATEPGNGPRRRGIDAPPVLLLHGFTGSSADWRDWPPRFAWHPEEHRAAAILGRPVLALDLPGHGPSPGARTATMDGAVGELLAALDHRGLGKVHLVGYSMGGRVALALAAAHPDRLAGLALIGASAGIEDEAERDERRRRDETLAREIETPVAADGKGGLEGFVDRWMALPVFATQARLGHRHLRLARLRRLAGSSRGYATSLRGMGQGAQPSYWADLPEIEVPTLLVAGALDEKYVRLARRMAEALPHARVEIVPDAGHAAHLEAPVVVGGAIRDHIEEAERGV